jgi:class III poly(R)-hydroxyalkanoic acid synthase PhaE subunit
MDWAEYTKSMTEAWVEAQKALWESWAEMMSTKPQSASNSKQTDLTNIYSQIAQQNMKAWESGAAPIARTTAEQFIAVQETSTRFLSFAARLWEAMEPQLEGGGDWVNALEKNLEQFRTQLIQYPEFAKGTVEDIESLYEQYIQQWGRFGQPWSAAFQQAPEYYARMMGGDNSAMIGLSNLYRDAYQQTLAHLVASPGLGMTRELNEKFQLGFDAWVSWQLATFEYQGILSGIWDQAIKKFQEDIISLAEEGQKIETLRDFVLLWTRGAEGVFTGAFQGEDYVLAQGQMLNAAMAYRIKEREIIEVFQKLYDLPTRSEMDETHRRIYELRKEVKALRKEVIAHKETIAEMMSPSEGDKP